MATRQSVPVEAAQVRPNRAKGGRFTRKPSSRQMELTVNTRQHTPQEARQYTAAFDLLVAEIVRAELQAAKE